MDIEEAMRLLNGGPNGIQEWNSRRAHGETIPSLRNADLRSAMLNSAKLNQVELNGAKFFNANLSQANLSGADLSRAELGGVNLNGADLSGTDFAWADLSGADFNGAICRYTTFSDVDLSESKGLESVDHKGPSTIGIDTVIKSKGNIPAVFLRGCGVPDAWIEYIPSLIKSANPFEFQSVFLSYSTRDETFTSMLHKDFEVAGVRCWKWDHNVKTGQTLWSEISRNIPVHDKLVLIASEASLKSPQVNREIERAIQEEDRRKALKAEGKFDGEANVLFPVRLDDYILKGWEHERKPDVIAKMIADGRGWDKGEKVYKDLLDRLLRDLKAEA